MPQFSTRYTVHGTRYTVHGTRYTVHGTRYTVHGTRYTEYNIKGEVTKYAYLTKSTNAGSVEFHSALSLAGFPSLALGE